MKQKSFLMLVVSVMAVIFLAAFQPAAAALRPAAQPSHPAADASPTPGASSAHSLTAEGKVVPNHSVDLAFTVSGKLSEILVKKGDSVKKGDVLARIGDTEQLQAAVANAQLAELTAQQNLDDLNKNTDVARAAILTDMSVQQANLKESQFDFDNFEVSPEQLKMDPITAVSVMKKRLDDARTAFDPYRFQPQYEFVTDKNSTEAQNRKQLKDTLDAAQHEYNCAVERLKYDFEVQAAKAALAKDQRDLDAMKNSGPDEEKLALAKASLQAAKANVAAAQATLDDATLTATFDGTIVDDMDIIVGKEVSPGVPVLKLGDISQLYIETDNLTENDVVKISQGQKVTVVADALPEVEMAGAVDYIPSVFVEKRGDVTYTVKIKLDKIDPRLRWGMTVQVSF